MCVMVVCVVCVCVCVDDFWLFLFSLCFFRPFAAGRIYSAGLGF